MAWNRIFYTLHHISVFSQDEADSLSWHGQQDFLATADYLSTYRISILLENMQNAAMEILKE